MVAAARVLCFRSTAVRDSQEGKSEMPLSFFYAGRGYPLLRGDTPRTSLEIW